MKRNIWINAAHILGKTIQSLNESFEKLKEVKIG